MAFYRRRAGLTQHQLAQLVGRSKDWTGKIESQAWELNRLPILQKLADTLGVTIADLNPAVAAAPHADGPATPPDRADAASLLATLSSYPSSPTSTSRLRAGTTVTQHSPPNVDSLRPCCSEATLASW